MPDSRASALPSWTFSVADKALDFLGAGETLVQVYTVTVTDSVGSTGTEQVTIRFTGTNDAPHLSVGFFDTPAGSVTKLTGVTVRDTL